MMIIYMIFIQLDMVVNNKLSHNVDQCNSNRVSIISVFFSLLSLICHNSILYYYTKDYYKTKLLLVNCLYLTDFRKYILPGCKIRAKLGLWKPFTNSHYLKEALSQKESFHKNRLFIIILLHQDLKCIIDKQNKLTRMEKFSSGTLNNQY